MRSDAQVSGRDLVIPLGDAGLELDARPDDELRNQHRRGVGGLAARERHQVVDDREREARVPLDLLDVGERARRVRSGRRRRWRR